MKLLLTTILATLISFNFHAQSSSAKDVCAKSDKYIAKKKFQDAYNVLTKGIEQMPDSIILYMDRGSLLYSIGMKNEAIIDYRTGYNKSTDPKIKAIFLTNTSTVKQSMRDFEGAYKDLTKAHSLDSTSIATLNNLATVCDEVGKPDLTLVYLNRIITIDSTFTGAYINLGYKYQIMGEYQKSIDYLNKAAALNPNEAFIYSNRSFSRLKLNDFKGAHEDIDKSIKLYANNSYAFKVKALILIEEKNFTESCIHLKTASELGYTAQYGLEVEELQKKHCK